VREWYEQEDACRLLLYYSNGDPLLEIAELCAPLHDTHRGGPHDLFARGLLPFRFENQGVCVWAVQLSGSDDPPVVVDLEIRGQEAVKKLGLQNGCAELGRSFVGGAN